MSVKKALEITASHHDYVIKLLQDPKQLEAYLEVVIEEYKETRDVRSLLVSLRNIVEAKGGITKLAEKTKLNRQALYRTLSLEGNPRLDTLDIILKELGFEIDIKPIQKTAA